MIKGSGSLSPAAKEFVKWRTQHNRFVEALNEIGDTHSMSGVEGTGMLVMGAPGLGKSSILKSYRKHHLKNRNDLEGPNGSKEPIILVSVPSEPTQKTLLQQILRASSYAGSTEGTAGKLRQKLDEFIVGRGVELLILDEFQHFLPEQARFNTRGVVNQIKLLMDEHKLSVVMAGIPQGYRSIAKHEELYQRFAHNQVRLEPFNAEDRLKEFGKYMHACRVSLEKRGFEMIRLEDEEMLTRLFLATKGIPRLITHLLLAAITSTGPGETVTINDLKRAFSSRSLNPSLGKFDPFSAPIDTVKEKARKALKAARIEESKHWSVGV